MAGQADNTGLLPFEQTCAELDVSPATLRRWLQAGAPQAKVGRRGRGGQALFEPAAIAAWRRQIGGGDALIVLASELSEIVADSVYLCFRLADGAHKRPSADMLAATWYVITTALLERIGEQVPVRGIEVMPEKIERLRRIAEGRFVDVRREFFDWKEFPRYAMSRPVPTSKFGVYEALRDSFVQSYIEDKNSSEDSP
jgi:hypothetical protein